MKRKDLLVLDNQDNKAVELFSDLGVPRNLAKTLMYISQVDECKSADIEQAADLRQPEVSIVMKELHRRGWVTRKYLKKEGKGRPTHIYKPTMNLSEIVETFEQEKLKEVETINNDLSELRNLIEGR
jgi:predicted transcriptional regulator